MNGKKFYQHLYFQVLTAISIGVCVGHFYPETGAAMKPLGDGFIKLIKMIIAPVIFCTVVTGIAGMEDMKKVGRVGAKALLYFEIVSTLALAIGLLVVSVIQPGVGMNADVTKLDTKGADHLHRQRPPSRTASVDFLMNIIPNSVVDAFAKGDILQVLFFAILFGFALSMLGERGKPVFKLIDEVSHVLFGIVGIIMKVAPIGAFGAMAFTIGKFGLGSLTKLGMLMGSFYLTCLLFIFVVLGTIAKLCGFSIFKFIKLHQGRAADRAGHLFLRIGPAAHDGQAGEPGLHQVGGRPGHPHRLLLQPGRHLHLPDHGRDLRGPGHQHPADRGPRP